MTMRFGLCSVSSLVGRPPPPFLVLSRERFSLTFCLSACLLWLLLCLLSLLQPTPKPAVGGLNRLEGNGARGSSIRR